MILQYFPSEGIMIDNTGLSFLERRDLIRVRLNLDYEEENQTIELGEGDIEPLQLRRDIYKDTNSAALFFLNYNTNDLLTEVEVHQCERIQVLNISFEFTDEIDFVALRLSEYSEISILSEGEVLFKDLKMVLSDKRKMGAEGSSIGYFYCALDISHLL